MNAAIGFYTLVGLAVAMFGFFRRPKTWGELVYPRFLIPLLFWMFGLFPVAYYYYMEPPNQAYAAYRLYHQEQAMLYVLLCMLVFWLGFRFRLRIPRLERYVHNTSIRFDYPRIQRAGLLIATLTGIFLLSTNGSALLDGHDTLELEGVLGYISRYMILPLNVLAAIAYGFGWPDKGETRRPFVLIGALYILIICSLPLVANFSRGSGLFPMFMVLGYVGRFRRIPWITMAISIFLLIYCAHVGLTGRGLYGHAGGAINYVRHFMSGADYTFLAASERVMAGEALTPLSVIMASAAAGADIGAISPLHWLYFQIPLPHMFGFGGVYTLDATHFLGGQGTWGYTASMFGDTFAHFGWWGCLPFLYMGMLYRLLEELVADYDSGNPGGTLAFLTLPVAYYAFLLGIFNTFRSWNSTFTFGIAIMLIVMGVYAKLKNTQPQEYYLPETQPAQ